MSTANDLQPPTTEAGWYPDPAQVWAWRWFDGTDWTGTVNDGQTNHSDLASLMAVRERLTSAAGAPPPPQAVPPAPAPAPTQAAAATKRSAGNIALRIVGWSMGGVVAIFLFFVAIGLVVGTDPEPVAVVDGAELFAIVEFTKGQKDESWIVVVEPGTSVNELEGITRNLLALPQAQGLQISFTFFDSDDELEEFVAFGRALSSDFDVEDVEDLIDTAEKFDVDTIKQNTVGYVEWIDARQEYVICPGTVALCGVSGAVASFTE